MAAVAPLLVLTLLLSSGLWHSTVALQRSATAAAASGGEVDSVGPPEDVVVVVGEDADDSGTDASEAATTVNSQGEDEQIIATPTTQTAEAAEDDTASQYHDTAEDDAAAVPAAAAAAPVAACQPGYQPEGGACVDVNECSSYVDRSAEIEEDRRDACGNYVHSHRPGYRCVNTPGSFRCERMVDCGFGYVLNETSGACVDIDECAILGYAAACGTTLPIKVCINMDGTFRCDYRSCPPGRHLDRTTGECNPCRRGYAKDASDVCQDIDECQRPGLNNCPPHMRCTNYPGGYECKHKIFCPMGRRTNYNGTKCIDIDECAEQPRICGLGRDCINFDGTYQCEQKQCGKLQQLNGQSGECDCVDGFRMSVTSRTCEDINECAENSHNCDAGDVCRNSRGHFDCLSRDKVCEPGFGLKFDHSTCADIDECKLGQHKCSDREYCNNTHGSYACLCRDGYQRIGSTKECTDIDECSAAAAATAATRPCPPPFVCSNTVGSFACRCPPGHRPDTATGGRTCQDVDECAELPSVCGPTGRCLNRPPGAYTCQCPVGFMANETVGGACVDVDECKLRACPPAAACTNTQGGYDCECRAGFRFYRARNECEDIDECQSQNATVCPAGLRCFNYRGSHSCYSSACPAGFRLSGSPPQSRLNALSFNCEATTRGCQLTPSLHGNGTQPQMCVSRHRIVHKAHEMQSGTAEFATIQSDMRRGLRSCEFRANIVWAGSAGSLTVHYRNNTTQPEFPNLKFHQKELGQFTICSTQFRLGGRSIGVTRVHVVVALVGPRSVDISSHTVHIVQV